MAVTIENTLTEFLRDPTNNLNSAATVTSYRSVLRLLSQQSPGRHLDRWSETDLVEFLSQSRLAPSSRRAYRKVVLSFFRWAAWRGYVSADPTLNLKRLVRPRDVPVKHHSWLERGQVRAMFDVCGDDVAGRRDRLVLLLGFHTGLRRSEIAGLRWGDLDETVVRVVGKGNKAAQVPLSRDLRAGLGAWRVLHPQAGPDGSNVPLQGPVVPRLRRTFTDIEVRWDEPLGRAGVTRIVARRAEQAGLGRVAPHDMRRTFAGLLEKDGVRIETISQLLRHDSIATTQMYLADNPDRGIQAMREFTI